jgi:hypothetical protein
MKEREPSDLSVARRAGTRGNEGATERPDQDPEYPGGNLGAVRYQPLARAVSTASACEAVGQDAAGEIRAELALHPRREAEAV